MAQPDATIPQTGEQRNKTAPVQTPEYDYQSPTGTYYGEQGNGQADAIRRMINEWAARNDPKAQAEQDAKAQRGRDFWTGANLFANVIANAINAHGTANGAPAMKWDDSATQKMYDTWQTADRGLRADRMEARQRLDALRLQDAQMTAQGSERRAEEERKANDMNFNIALENARHERQREEAEADWARNRDEQMESENRRAEQREREARTQHGYRISEQDNANRNARELAAARAQTAKGYDKGKKTIRIGNTDFKAETEAEADANIAQVYGMVLDAYNRTKDPLSRRSFDVKPETQYGFINAYINRLYESDADFKEKYDAWAEDHRRSVSDNSHRQGGSRINRGGNQDGNSGNPESWLK